MKRTRIFFIWNRRIKVTASKPGAPPPVTIMRVFICAEGARGLAACATSEMPDARYSGCLSAPGISCETRQTPLTILTPTFSKHPPFHQRDFTATACAHAAHLIIALPRGTGGVVRGWRRIFPRPFCCNCRSSDAPFHARMLPFPAFRTPDRSSRAANETSLPQWFVFLSVRANHS